MWILFPHWDECFDSVIQCKPESSLTMAVRCTQRQSGTPKTTFWASMIGYQIFFKSEKFPTGVSSMLFCAESIEDMLMRLRFASNTSHVTHASHLCENVPSPLLRLLIAEVCERSMASLGTAVNESRFGHCFIGPLSGFGSYSKF